MFHHQLTTAQLPSHLVLLLDLVNQCLNMVNQSTPCTLALVDVPKCQPFMVPQSKPHGICLVISMKPLDLHYCRSPSSTPTHHKTRNMLHNTNSLTLMLVSNATILSSPWHSLITMNTISTYQPYVHSLPINECIVNTNIKRWIKSKRKLRTHPNN